MAVEQVTLTAMVDRHKLDVSDEQRRFMADSIRHWPDGPVTVTVKRQRPEKSQLQLGYYYGCILPMIAEESGNEIDAVHRELKKLFLQPLTYEWVDKTTGEVEPRMALPSLSDLNTKEMAEYSERCRLWAAEFLGLQIPEPDPHWRATRRKRSAA